VAPGITRLERTDFDAARAAVPQCPWLIVQGDADEVVPQEAVLQGAQGHFVVIVDKEGKAQIRPVEVGPWDGSGNWFINRGLVAGETVVTDGVMRLAPGAPVKIIEAGVKSAPADSKPAPAATKR